MLGRLIPTGLILIGLASLAIGVYGWWTEPPWPPPRASIAEPEREINDLVAGEETIVGFEFKNPTAKPTLIGGLNRC